MSRTGCWRLRRTPSIAAPSARQPSSSVTKCSSARISCATSKKPSSKPRRLQTSDLRQWLEERSQRRPTREDALTNVADAMSAVDILEGLPNRLHEVIVRHVAERPDHLAFVEDAGLELSTVCRYRGCCHRGFRTAGRQS